MENKQNEILENNLTSKELDNMKVKLNKNNWSLQLNYDEMTITINSTFKFNYDINDDFIKNLPYQLSISEKVIPRLNDTTNYEYLIQVQSNLVDKKIINNIIKYLISKLYE